MYSGIDTDMDSLSLESLEKVFKKKWQWLTI